MTVIAYKDGKIAGDRVAINRGTIVAQRTKIAIHEGDGVLIGCSGTGSDCDIMRAWIMECGARAATLAPPAQIKNVSALIVYASNRAEIIEASNDGFERENLGDQPFIAIGAGQDYAMGAMAAGASAVDAALIACRLSINCGGGVDWLDRDGNGGRV